MSAPHAPRALRACAVLAIVAACAASVKHDSTTPTKKEDTPQTKRIELLDGVTVKIPHVTNSSKVLSLEINTGGNVETGRGKQKKLMQRILPLFIMPFLIQSTIVPFFLSMLKFMLFKSMMVGKLALGLILLNAFKNHNSFKGRHDEEMANVHYGYHGHGMEEYGAYMN